MAATVPLNPFKIDFSRIRVGPVKETREGGGLTALIEYVEDNGTTRPLVFQLPDGDIPFEFSSYKNEGKSFSVAWQLYTTGVWSKVMQFLEKVDEYVLNVVVERAKEFLPNDVKKKGFNKEMARGLQNSCIRYAKDAATNYPPTFSTHVQKKNQKVGKDYVPIEGQFDVACTFQSDMQNEPVAFDIRNLTAKSKGNGVAQWRAITVVNSKYGASFDLKEITVKSLGGSNVYQKDPNMFKDEEEAEQNFYDHEAIKMVEQFERKREEREEEELSETSKKEQEQQQQEATPKKSKKQKK